MTIKRYRLKDNHEHMKKYDKLCQFADDLGIRLYFYNNKSIAEIDGTEYDVEDLESPQPPSDFPPALEVKLVSEREFFSTFSQKLMSIYKPEVHVQFILAAIARIMGKNTIGLKEAEELADEAVMDGILKKDYEFIDESGEPIPVKTSEVNAARGGGRFYHPETGERVENFIFYPVYKPTDKLKELVKETDK